MGQIAVAVRSSVRSASPASKVGDIRGPFGPLWFILFCIFPVFLTPMSRPHRRLARKEQAPPPLQYAAVPQTSPSRHASQQYQHHSHPQMQPSHPYQQPSLHYQQSPSQSYQQPQYTSQVGGPRAPPAQSGRSNSRPSGRAKIAMGVASGTIGAGYGPYSYNPNHARDAGVYTNSRFSNGQSDASIATSSPTNEKEPIRLPVTPPPQNTQSIPLYLYDKDPDLDDALHDPRPDPAFASCTVFSVRGWINSVTLVAIVVALITLFVGYPVVLHFTNSPPLNQGFNVGGINGSGQIPDLQIPPLIDSDTPSSAYTRIGNDGKKYNLVFSDEFEVDGRSFYPGDDAYWEAVDIHYWPTGDEEWYDPGTITTSNGKLVITMSEKRSHNLNFESGMLTTWNKFCFNTGYIEVSVSLPGSPKAPGLWPGVWTMGNLGRAGYGATTDGMWPYSYDTCDLGTFPIQTARDGTPEAAATGSRDGTQLSDLPGQKLSACTCPDSDHPGPNVETGRGAPEIDIIEAQVDVSRFVGQVSQSFQVAPFNIQYQFDNATSATTIYNDDITRLNSYLGGPLQQAVSALTDVEEKFYNNNDYAKYGYEWWYDSDRRQDSFITWYSNGVPSWTITSTSIGPDPISQVSQRLISEEPMYVIMNLGIAPGFQKQDYKHLQFPVKMYIDYVRVYQRDGVKNGVTCNPSHRPTSDYIQKHINAYNNANLTTWALANNTFPRNRLYDGC